MILAPEERTELEHLLEQIELFDNDDMDHLRISCLELTVALLLKVVLREAR